MSKITVYTTLSCGYCTRVKSLLDQRGLAYEEINLSRDADGRSQLLRRTGMMTFPQVFVGDQLIGGFTETVLADRSGRLSELLAA